MQRREMMRPKLVSAREALPYGRRLALASAVPSVPISERKALDGRIAVYSGRFNRFKV